jgi:RNA polymerase sigma factor (sigma-70 family)
MLTVEIIVKRHSEWIRMAQYHGASEPEEAVQEMYLKLCEIQLQEGSLNRFDYNGQINTMYLFKIIQSKVVDAVRQRKREVYDEAQFNPVNPVEECEESYEALMTEVKAVIDTMGEYDQMLLELYFVYGFSMREIEKRTGIPLHSIFNRLQSARGIIKNKTKDLYYDYCDKKADTEQIERFRGHDSESDEGNWD